MLADGREHDRDALAARAGISPAGIDAAAVELQRLGLPVSGAGRARLRLPWPLEPLDAAAIRAALPAPVRLASVDVLWKPASTSDEVRRRLVDADAGWVVVAAETQSAGRGRRGRSWITPPGLSICFSLGAAIGRTVAALGGLSLAVGVEVRGALEAVGCRQAMLKWPNDVLIDGAKLGGILVEVDGRDPHRPRVVVGIGLNLRLPPEGGLATGQPVAALAAALPDAALARNALTALLVQRVSAGLERFAQDGFTPFAAAWAAADALAGRRIAVHDAGGVWTGTALGVAADGALRVRRGGQVVHVGSGEVSVRAS